MAEAGPTQKRAFPVGSYLANTWGLHDTHGNVFEWCRDWHHAKLPGRGPRSVIRKHHGDGQSNRQRVPSTPGRVLGQRGLSLPFGFCLRFEPERRHDPIGFRVVAVWS